MKSSKIILISLLLLLCATAKAQESVYNGPQVLSSSWCEYDPIHPEYSGTLSPTYYYSELMNLSGRFALEIIFYGDGNLFTLFLDTVSSGSHAYVNHAGQYLLYFEANGLIQLSFDPPTETANCNWRIYRCLVN